MDAPGDFQGVDTPRLLVNAQKGTHKMTNYHKTPRDGAAQVRVKRKHDGGGQEARNSRHDPPRDRLGTGRRLRTEGGRSGSINGGGSMEPRRANPQGLTETLETSTSAKGGQ